VANVLPSCLIADIRGKVGDQVFARNRGGLYVKSIPTWEHEISIPTQAAMDALGFCAVAWSNDLTDAQRQAWHTYAALHPIRGRMHGSNANKGRGWFVRSNFLIAYTQSLCVYPDPPTLPPQPPIHLTMSAPIGSTDAIMSMTSMDYGQDWQDIEVWAFAGQSTSQARNHYTLTWLFANKLPRNGLTWESNTFFIPLGYTIGANTRHWVRLIFQGYNDGRISAPSVNFADAT